MRKLFFLLCLVPFVFLRVQAMEIDVPTVPDSAKQFMPDQTDNFGESVLQLSEKVVAFLQPEIRAAAELGVSVFATAIVLSILDIFHGKGKSTTDLVGTVAVSCLLLSNTQSMIHTASLTIHELSHYGKLLYPVMTMAMAAQGGITASAALYTGTMILDSILASLLSWGLVPVIYLYLAVAITYAATGEAILKRIRDGIKGTVAWCLKLLLTIFTVYMSITGVVSGTTDAAALKATKVTISTFVPVVGGILSDASEAVLVGASLMKNSAGIYGMFAIVAIFLGPFIKIASCYLILKVIAALCQTLGSRGVASVTEDCSTAMGLLLAMTGSVCVMLLVSVVCFMKGVG